MIRLLPYFLELALLVFCLIDCIQTDSSIVRNLPKPAWILLIIVLPLIGGIAWLVAGRPERTASAPRVPWPSTRTSGYPEYERPRPPRGPDDDPDFLRQMKSVDEEHERTMRQWEDDLKERERRLREQRPDDGTPPA
ncbi:PLDc N-terminal domain-containing protein [Angustibacter aerolatus]